MLVQCPSCAKQLNVPDTAVGKKAKCPSCTKVFEITAPASEAVVPVAPKPPPPPAHRHDEEEDDRPRRRPRDEDDDDDRPRRRSRDDEDDDDDRPRSRSREEEDEEELDRPRRRTSGAKSGAVTSLGVINIVLGSLVLLGGLCMMLGALFFASAAADVNRMNPNAGGNMFALAGGLAIVFALLILLVGAGWITAGVGVLKRRSWGRIVSFVLAGLCCLGALWAIYGMISVFGLPSGFPGKTQAILTQLLSLLINAGYAAFAFVVLLNARNAAEFR